MELEVLKAFAKHAGTDTLFSNMMSHTKASPAFDAAAGALRTASEAEHANVMGALKKTTTAVPKRIPKLGRGGKVGLGLAAAGAAGLGAMALWKKMKNPPPQTPARRVSNAVSRAPRRFNQAFTR